MYDAGFRIAIMSNDATPLAKQSCALIEEQNAPVVRLTPEA